MWSRLHVTQHDNRLCVWVCLCVCVCVKHAMTTVSLHTTVERMDYSALRLETPTHTHRNTHFSSHYLLLIYTPTYAWHMYCTQTVQRAFIQKEVCILKNICFKIQLNEGFINYPIKKCNWGWTAGPCIYNIIHSSVYVVFVVAVKRQK